MDKTLIEFKPRYKNAIYGIRNRTGAYRAYVWDLGLPKPESQKRYSISALRNGEPTLTCDETNDVEEAKALARRKVQVMCNKATWKRR